MFGYFCIQLKCCFKAGSFTFKCIQQFSELESHNLSICVSTEKQSVIFNMLKRVEGYKAYG